MDVDIPLAASLLVGKGVAGGSPFVEIPLLGHELVDLVDYV